MDEFFREALLEKLHRRNKLVIIGEGHLVYEALLNVIATEHLQIGRAELESLGL
jgi:hypothetical protein